MTLRATEYPGHRCRCTVADIDDSRKPDRCGAIISNPDQPVCDPCLERHADLGKTTTFLKVWLAEP